MSVRKMSGGLLYTTMLAGNSTFVSSAFELIETQTVGAGGAASVTFSSIPGTYKHLQIRWIAKATAQDIYLRFNNDTGNNYASLHQLRGDGSAASSASLGQNTFIYGGLVSNTANIFGGLVTDILDYQGNKNKTVRTLGGYDTNGAGYVYLRSGLWMNTTAVTSIKFEPASGSIDQYSLFSLYGLR